MSEITLIDLIAVWHQNPFIFKKKAWLIGTLISVSFLVSCTSTPQETTDKHITPCSTENLINSPVVALDWNQLVETHLAPGAGKGQLALDYLVFPMHAVNRVQLSPDFDPAIKTSEISFNEDCPRGIPVSALTDLFENDIISASITIGHSDTSQVRHGRITIPKGNRTMRINSTDVPEEKNWWFLLEPGRGSSRVILLPVDRLSSVLEVNGLPNIAYTVALVHTDLISWDSENQVAYSPPGFSSTWRSAVNAWHGAVVKNWKDQEPIILPQLLKEIPFSVPTFPITAEVKLSTNQPMALLQISETSAQGTLTFPCVRKVEIISTSFTDMTIEEGDKATNIMPGNKLIIEPACAGDETTSSLSISGTPLNGRTGYTIARLIEEES